MKKAYLPTIVALLSITLSTSSCQNDDEMDGSSPINLEGIEATFIDEVKYDDKERTQFDIFLPSSEQPTPLVIYIHGGGFKSGDKDFAYSPQKSGKWDFPSDIRTFLNNGIAFASVRYSLLDSKNEMEGILKPMNDVKRALQYIRNHAESYNINKELIVLSGNSAGGGTSLWIGLNDDMADPGNPDPVLRESTTVKGIAIRNTQCTYELMRWETDVFVDFDFEINDYPDFQNAVNEVYGIDNFDKFQSPEIIEYRQKVDMLELMSLGDPDIWVDNTLFENGDPQGDRNIMNHHPFHARELKERSEQVGVPITAYYGDPILFQDPSEETWAEFCIRLLNI